MTELNRRWMLRRRPTDSIQVSDFEFIQEPLPVVAEGEVVVKVAMLSCDPTQRTWLSDADNYLPPVPIGSPMRSVGAGTVVASRHTDFAVGDLVAGILSWEDYACFAPVGMQTLGRIPRGAPLEQVLYALSPSGMAGYFGMLDVARPKAGETVVVSAAAGATGSLAAQIAKRAGCRVIGIAGGPEKCNWLTQSAGLDGAIDYKTEDVESRLQALCPDGIDIFFDNVGGSLLDLALEHMAVHGRAILCGAIAHYNDATPAPAPKRQLDLWKKSIRIEGFLVRDYMARQAELLKDLTAWIADEKLAYRLDVQEGLENAPQTLLRLFSGANQGKQRVQGTADES